MQSCLGAGRSRPFTQEMPATPAQELDGLQNCLGTELAGPHGEAKVLNGAVLKFEKGS